MSKKTTNLYLTKQLNKKRRRLFVFKEMIKNSHEDEE